MTDRLAQIRQQHQHMDEFWRKLASNPKSASVALENAASLATLRPVLQAISKVPPPRSIVQEQYEAAWRVNRGL